MATSTETPPAWADSKDAWLGRVHDAVLPSGMKVTYRDPSLAELAYLGELPGELLEIALAEWHDPGSALDLANAPLQKLREQDKVTAKQRAAAEQESKQILGRIVQVNRHLVAAALVEPRLSVQELERVPMPDLEMLSELINRTTASDAAGRTVGVVLVDRFRVIFEAHGHEPCTADCQACETARRQLATAR